MRRQVVDFSHPVPTKVEFVQFSGLGERDQANTHGLTRFLTTRITVEFASNTRLRRDMALLLPESKLPAHATGCVISDRI
jgi:hypothetical protein